MERMVWEGEGWLCGREGGHELDWCSLPYTHTHARPKKKNTRALKLNRKHFSKLEFCKSAKSQKQTKGITWTGEKHCRKYCLQEILWHFSTANVRHKNVTSTEQNGAWWEEVVLTSIKVNKHPTLPFYALRFLLSDFSNIYITPGNYWTK